MSSLHRSWESEVQSAWLYQVLAELETGERRKLFAALSADALHQSRAWVRALEEAGAPAPGPYEPPPRVRLVARLIRRFGPRPLLPVLAALKVRGLSVYRSTPTTLEALLAKRTGPAAALPARQHILEEERRHAGTRRATAFRAAVFGINDGLVSNTALILGVGGATGDSGFVLVAGAAGLIAGSLSMAAGEYLSVRSQIEMLEQQIALEEEELRLYPDDEAAELALIFEARGISPAEARELANRLIADPERALDVLAQEELGLNPGELGSPWAAAIASFVSFGVGAVVPLLPFALAGGTTALAAGASLALVALFGAGAASSLFTGKSAVRSGLRMAAIGGGAAALTHAVGRLFGVVVG